MRKVTLFDTTLRDGTQAEGISLTVEDKIKIAKLLDKLGIHYIEGGWPGSNPKDIEFFKKIKDEKLKHAKMVAFSSTRRAGKTAANDPNIKALLEAETPAVSIFGKSWDLHVREALRVSLEENLEMITDTIKYCKSKGREVIYDAEHFFDGYKANPDYAIKTLLAAEAGGADVLVLCDTNGGTLAFETQKIINEVKSKVNTPLGIHAHNDSECAVSVTGMAVYCGCSHVQGTINGYGERCGNANLCSIIPILKLKLGIDCISDQQLKTLTEVAHHVAEIANLALSPHQPFVGRSAFAHKGGIHVSAVAKNATTYEHIEPELVGNSRRVTVSELSGLSNLIYKAKEFGIDLEKDDPKIKNVLKTLKELEHEGYSFEEGEASFELMLKRELGIFKPKLELDGFRVIDEKQGEKNVTVEATIRVIAQGKLLHTAADGNGPVSALDNALRKAIGKIYPVVHKIKLTDYKVRVLDSEEGTAAKVRVIIESSDEKSSWGTVGVSSNIIEASWHALMDSMEYKLMKEKS
ncbi:MAG: citramalate synthase [bacterium]